METHPWQSKPEVPWDEVRERVQSGETFAALSEDLKTRGVEISAWGISKHCKKQGWLKSGGVSTDWLVLCQDTLTAKTLANPEGAAAGQIVRYGKRTLEKMAEILTYRQTGCTKSAAAQAVGISDDMLEDWLKDDLEFSDLWRVASGQFVTRNIARMDRAAEHDWRAADKLLSSIPDAREHWQPNVGGYSTGTGGVTVVVNVKRAGDVEIAGKVATVEAEG